MTKQEIINELYSYNVKTLEKLLIIADTIIYPQKDGLTQIDFSGLVDAVFKSGGYADTFFPEWTDRGKGDFGRFLVELFAMFSDKDFFYINHFSREAHGSTAELYRNLLHKAISNNIEVSSNIAASEIFDLVFENGIDTDYERGSIQIGLDGFDNKTFSNRYSFTLPANSTTPEPTTPVEFIHGVIEERSGEFDGKSILIDKENIVADTVELKINGVDYTGVNSFADGNPSTKHFKVFLNSVGQAEIMFADPDYGVTPMVGDTFEVSFFVGGGSAGNIVAGLLDTIIACPDRQIINFAQPQTTGGIDLMKTGELRQFLINKQRNNNRMVDTSDVNQIISELDFVRRVYSQSVANYVFIYIVTESGTPLSPLQELSVEAHMAGKLLMGYSALISNPPSVSIYMVVDVYVLPNVDNSSVTAQADEVIKDYLIPSRNGEFGEGVKRGKLSNLLLKTIEGSQNVVFPELNTDGIATGIPNDIVVEPNVVINYAASTVIINVIGG